MNIAKKIIHTLALFVLTVSLKAQEPPNDCVNPYMILPNGMPNYSYGFIDLCDEGFSDFYFGFFYPEIPAGNAISLQFTFHTEHPSLWIESIELYGTYPSLQEACSGLEAPLDVNYVQDYLDNNVSVDHDIEGSFGSSYAGYYFVRIRACVSTVLSDNSGFRLSCENQKVQSCPIPCDYLDCDNPPCDDSDCDDPPCDSLPPCDWYPLACDDCYYYPDSCNTLPPSPCDNVITTGEQTDCLTCIGSFAPIPGKSYVVEGWTREKDAGPLVSSFTLPKIKVRFYDGFETQIGGGETISTQGPIVEGWQQIRGEVEVPEEAIRMELELFVDGNSGDEAYFDDIRVSPVNSSMQTYVYDQVSMRLTEQLDDRNFATFFEYDEEGNLVATKKETERGIKTIRTIHKNTSTNHVQ